MTEHERLQLNYEKAIQFGVDLQRAVQPREGVFVVAGIQLQLAEVVAWFGKCHWR